MVVRASVLILLRQLIVQGTMVLCGIWMARNATPAEFGVYAFCNFLIPLLGLLSDLGLGAWLVRAAESPSEQTLRSAFTVRQGIDLLLALLFIGVSPLCARWYHLDAGQLATIRLLALVPILTSFGLIPAVQLERTLRFHVVATIEIAQILGFGVAVFVGLEHHWGPVAAVAGWVAHAVIGAALYQLAWPWRPRWQIDRAFLKTALPFALPFQATAAVMTFRDGVIPLLVAASLGGAAVGTLNWAQMLALSIATGSFVAQRALLPSFAKHLAPAARHLLRADAEVALLGIVSCVLSAATPILIYARPMCHYIFGDQWLGSLSIFYVLWPLNILIPGIVVITALRNALGHSVQVLRAFLISATTLWVLTALCIPWMGLIGYAAALSASYLTLLSLAPLSSREIQWHPCRVAAPTLGWITLVAAAAWLCGVPEYASGPFDLLVQMAAFAALLLLGCAFLGRRHLSSLGGEQLATAAAA